MRVCFIYSYANTVLIFSRYYDRSQEMEDPIVFPFHEVCYKDILSRCFKNKMINEDVFYALCEEMRQDRWNSLALSYGDPDPPSGQYWECRKGEEVNRLLN